MRSAVLGLLPSENIQMILHRDYVSLARVMTDLNTYKQSSRPHSLPLCLNLLCIRQRGEDSPLNLIISPNEDVACRLEQGMCAMSGPASRPSLQRGLLRIVIAPGRSSVRYSTIIVVEMMALVFHPAGRVKI